MGRRRYGVGGRSAASFRARRVAVGGGGVRLGGRRRHGEAVTQLG